MPKNVLKDLPWIENPGVTELPIDPSCFPDAGEVKRPFTVSLSNFEITFNFKTKRIRVKGGEKEQRHRISAQLLNMLKHKGMLSGIKEAAKTGEPRARLIEILQIPKPPLPTQTQLREAKALGIPVDVKWTTQADLTQVLNDFEEIRSLLLDVIKHLTGAKSESYTHIDRAHLNRVTGTVFEREEANKAVLDFRKRQGHQAAQEHEHYKKRSDAGKMDHLPSVTEFTRYPEFVAIVEAEFGDILPKKHFFARLLSHLRIGHHAHPERP